MWRRGERAEKDFLNDRVYRQHPFIFIRGNSAEERESKVGEGRMGREIGGGRYQENHKNSDDNDQDEQSVD